jgi:hypothetical protein
MSKDKNAIQQYTEHIVEKDSVVQTMDVNELLSLAAVAEERVNAIVKIRNTAIKLTNANDWIDQNGKPYLQASGAEKIAGAFGISWTFVNPEPFCEVEEDGHYIYTYQGLFTMSSRKIQVDGSRSSKDPFFKQYRYIKKAGGGHDEKVEKTIAERDNKRDVKMSAYTNMIGNGITRILGIRNLTYADLEEFAGIKKDQLGKVEYKKKPPINKATTKSESKENKNANQSSDGQANTNASRVSDEVMIKVKNVTKKSGKNESNEKEWTKYTIHTPGGSMYSTFDKGIAEAAEKIKDTDHEACVIFETYNSQGVDYLNICENGFVVT